MYYLVFVAVITTEDEHGIVGLGKTASEGNFVLGSMVSSLLGSSPGRRNNFLETGNK